MILVLSSAEAFNLDKMTIDSDYTSKNELMDKAGLLSAQYIVENINDPFNNKFIILAGPGNNGCDGIICHYYLRYYNVDSTLILLDESIIHSWIFKKYSIPENDISFFSDTYKFSHDYWYIDCIFGIGFNRPSKGNYKKILQKLSNVPNIISIDIPSGIYSDTGCSDKYYINSKMILAMGCHKIAYYFNMGLETSSKIYTLDIGLHPIRDSKKHVHCIEFADVSSCALKWKKNVHKYSRGKVCAIAGSSKYTGAGILAIKAAMVSGAGIVKSLISESMKNLYNDSLPEAIVLPIINDGMKLVIDEIDWSDIVLFGPGLSDDDSSVKWMANILKSINKPLVLDASGFLPISKKIINIEDIPINTILTPHYGEFADIFDINIDIVCKNPISTVKLIIPKLGGRILILKGPTTIIVNSKGHILLMNHGSPILSTAGTGDVLSGILSSIIAQGMGLDEAAIYSTYFHAECGMQYEKRIGKRGLLASDLINMIPYATGEMI